MKVLQLLATVWNPQPPKSLCSMYLSKNCDDNTKFTAQKIKFSMKYFFSKCDQIHNFLCIWSHLQKKSLIENFIFCAVIWWLNDINYYHACSPHCMCFNFRFKMCFNYRMLICTGQFLTELSSYILDITNNISHGSMSRHKYFITFAIVTIHFLSE